jgi:hypothetical protein
LVCYSLNTIFSYAPYYEVEDVQFHTVSLTKRKEEPHAKTKTKTNNKKKIIKEKHKKVQQHANVFMRFQILSLTWSIYKA